MPGSTDAAARNLIEVGSPMRASRRAPHVMGRWADDRRAGTARPAAAYLEQQMHAFKAGNRHNDISEQMRSVARQLRGEEIVMLAAYYSSFAGTNPR